MHRISLKNVTLLYLLQLSQMSSNFVKSFTRANLKQTHVHSPPHLVFYPRQLYRQVLLRARISYGNSVRLSITTQYGFNAR